MKRSFLTSSFQPHVLGVALCIGVLGQGCTQPVPSPTGSNASELGGGSDSGAADSSTSDSSVDGGTATDSGGGDGYAYAFEKRKDQDRHHVIDLEPGASSTISFTWRDAPGLAPPADLWVVSAGQTLLQVSALGNSPFAHAGLDVVPLVAGETYSVVFSRTDESVVVTIADASDHVVLATQATATSADLVFPATFWRASIVSDLK
jgi:hypothetical protein